MSDEKPTLVLHLTAGGSPVLFPIQAEDRGEVERNLPLWLDHGSVHSVRTADGATISVNFAHVALAFIDDAHRVGAPFGIR